ncbi:hypothetical protein ACHAW6_002242 [Cyclotella cf. meneghiniana]
MRHRISKCISLIPASYLLLHRLTPAVGFLPSLLLRHDPIPSQPASVSYPRLCVAPLRTTHTPCCLSLPVPANRRRTISVTTFIDIARYSQPRLHPKNFMTALSYRLLSAQNANTTEAIIAHFSADPAFISLSEAEGSLILSRDEEDAFKLQKGIDIAKSKGVIDPSFVPEEYVVVDVMAKSPDTVADEILERVRAHRGQGGSGGGVVVLCGLSGTGKARMIGTTVAKLREKLEKEDNKRVVTWSNGNIFRSVTLLASTWCEQQTHCDGFDAEQALTKENLANFMNMLKFGKYNGKFDTRICGLGLDLLVSEVENTELKAPKVAKNIPTVAEVTQGEVILFAADAIQKMGEDGIFVLLEGREQTVNYVRTPLRFTLTLSDMSLIGKRRAAQRLAAGALGMVGPEAGEEEIIKALETQLAIMVKEHS